MIVLHALAAGAAGAACCCLALSANRRDRRAWVLAVLMLAAMSVGLAGGSMGMIGGGLALVAAAPIAVTGARDERIRGLHRGLGTLAMGAIMIAGAGHGAMTTEHSHGYGVVLVVGIVALGVVANLFVLLPTARKGSSPAPVSLTIAGEALFMVAGVALMAAA